MGNSAAVGSWLIYQPLIVGLGAVVIATLGNTLLEWYRHHLRHSRETATLRSAFLQELRTQRAMVTNSLNKDQREEKEGAFVIPVDDFMPVYHHMIGRIGVLEPDEVSSVLEAYSYLILAPKNLGLIGHLRKDEFSSFMVVGVEHVASLLALNEKLAAVLDNAIRVLSQRMPQSLKPAAVSPPAPSLTSG